MTVELFHLRFLQTCSDSVASWRHRATMQWLNLACCFTPITHQEVNLVVAFLKSNAAHWGATIAGMPCSYMQDVCHDIVMFFKQCQAIMVPTPPAPAPAICAKMLCQIIWSWNVFYASRATHLSRLLSVVLYAPCEPFDAVALSVHAALDPKNPCAHPRCVQEPSRSRPSGRYHSQNLI